MVRLTGAASVALVSVLMVAGCAGSGGDTAKTRDMDEVAAVLTPPDMTTDYSGPVRNDSAPFDLTLWASWSTWVSVVFQEGPPQELELSGKVLDGRDLFPFYEQAFGQLDATVAEPYGSRCSIADGSCWDAAMGDYFLVGNYRGRKITVELDTCAFCDDSGEKNAWVTIRY